MKEEPSHEWRGKKTQSIAIEAADKAPEIPGGGLQPVECTSSGSKHLKRSATSGPSSWIANPVTEDPKIPQAGSKDEANGFAVYAHLNG